MVTGARECMQAIKDFANIENGETSEDGLFTLQEVECLGACANAPMMQVNNEWVYEDLTPETTRALLEKWSRGEEPEVGPQNGRKNSIGPMGRTSLEEIPHTLHSRDFAQIKQDYETAKEAKK